MLIIIEMNLTLKSPAAWSSPFQLPFSRKPSIILTKLLKHKHFEECLQKTVSVAQCDRLIFQQVLTQLRDFLKESGQGRSELDLQEVGIEVSERMERVYYDISRCFIKCNTLKASLLEEKPTVKLSAAVLIALLKAYVRTANLNHIVCSSGNIFVKQRAWSKEISFQFNYTSVGFMFDIFRKKGVHRVDVMEYANYLPYFFFSEEKVKERFGYYLKIRSFAVNVLCIVLQRDTNFTKYIGNAEMYSEENFQQILEKVHLSFGEFLNNKQNQVAIEASSTILNINLLKFFQAVILRPRSADFQQFNSWGKVIQYFKVPFLSTYLNILQLQHTLNIKTVCIQRQSYLQGWIKKMWNEQHKFIKQKLTAFGIVKDFGQFDLILYVLYKHRLINEPNFANSDETYHPKFLQLVINMYSKIMQSSFFLQSWQSYGGIYSQQIHKSRNEWLQAATRKVNEYLINLTKESKKQKLLFVAKDRIDIKSVYDKCWHFRV